MPIVGLAAYLLARMPFEARYPVGYAAFHHPERWVYPTGEVQFCMAVVALEVLAIVLVLAARTTAPLGGRALLLAVGLFVLLVASAPFAMHADSTIGNLLVWQFLAPAWLLAFALGRGLFALERRASR
jgi:hypothetical protein